MVYTLSESILDIERFKKVFPEGYVPERNLAAIKCIYSLLEKTHQNEFYFKNKIFNHFVTDKNIKDCTYPSIQNEMPVAASITDLIVTKNGKPSEVLEIKSECDSFDRLVSQLPDYYKVFRNVSMVTGEKLFDKAKQRFADTGLGLYVIDSKGEFYKEREPVERYDLLNNIHNKNKLLGEGIGLSNDLIEKFGDFEVLAITINPYEDGVIDIKINYFE